MTPSPTLESLLANEQLLGLSFGAWFAIWFVLIHGLLLLVCLIHARKHKLI